MVQYLLKRILAMIPTLFGITLVSFLVINAAPGGPIDQKLQQLQFGGALSAKGNGGGHAERGVPPEVIEALKVQYGLDKPIHVRYAIWIKNIATMDFGNSFKFEEPVIDVIMSRMPVSLQFGVISLILTYLVCIPLGVFKAIKDGTPFDHSSSVLLFILYSIPPVMLAILLIVFLSGGSYLNLFPIGGLYSDNYSDLSMLQKMIDRVHHFILPLTCYMIGSFTFLTMLMKNSLLDVIKMDYVRTARAKGLTEKVVYVKHALRNALIPIVTGMSGILSVFFAGSIVIERIFQLDGMGLLGFTAVSARDYNLLMGLIFLQSLFFLVGRLIVDVLYMIVDPRIDFK